ncbi:DUF523 domain-containing protein [Shewanella yunxiaonensis]|uniref:DUF523 domain-containing protein n=1 Tax=Shewanella yunxiaonensis TaxID=2829809 RepID=A0ABX7YTX0_9GAMM|nr:DUF523 domain-containing protein [Shewanella yunxiaonensis]QUN05631.1 DUF523 domain-containing protein [Shewanella yunxiaonensis]
MNDKILVSACLMGEKVRYDGQDNLLNDPRMALWRQQQRLVVMCPEIAGGLATPRAPAEQLGVRVLTVDGEDVTEAFQRGAMQTINLARQQQVVMAILKARSPSCGVGQVYDGSFSRHLKVGDGVTAAALKSAGIAVFSELELDAAATWWQRRYGESQDMTLS